MAQKGSAELQKGLFQNVVLNVTNNATEIHRNGNVNQLVTDDIMITIDICVFMRGYQIRIFGYKLI